MALALTDMVVGQADKVVQQVIETFIRESEILELLPFDNAVSPTGGSTMVYGYIQEKAPSTASFRAIGSEYSSNEAKIRSLTANLKIFGGKFTIDRVLKTIEGKLQNMDYQLTQKIKASVQLFHDTMINGDTASNSLAFDGLDKMLVGTSNEMNTSSYIDLSNITNLKANADEFYEALLNLINKSNADAILVNEQLKTKIQTVARVLGYKTESEEAFGRVVTKIGERGVRIIDLGNKVDVDGETVTETPIIGKHGRSVGTGTAYTLTSDTALVTNKNYYTRGGSEGSYVYTKVTSPVVGSIASYYEYTGEYVTGLTDVYAVKFDINNGFTGVTIQGDKIIDTYLPDFKTPGAVKDGEVEMVSCVVLKNTKNAGVLRNIKVA